MQQGSKMQTKSSRVLKSTTTAVYNEAIMFIFDPSKNELAQTKITVSVHDMQRLVFGYTLLTNHWDSKVGETKENPGLWINDIGYDLLLFDHDITFGDTAPGANKQSD